MFERSPAIGQHFAFAHGRMGVLQQMLLTTSDIDRLLGAHDWRETQRIVLELPLMRLTGANATTADGALDATRTWIRQETAAMTPASLHHIFDAIWTEEDEPFVAYLLKERAGFVSSISHTPATQLTSVDPSILQQAVQTSDVSLLPKHQQADIGPLLTASYQHPRDIDIATAQAYAALRLRLAKQSHSTLIRSYVRHLIDLRNVRALLRCDATTASQWVLPGGSMAPSLLLSPNHTLASVVRISHFSFALADMLETNPLDAAALERMFADILAKDIADLWNTPLGIEPVFAFATLGLLQLSVVRALLIGKRNALAPQDIKRLLPPFLRATHFTS